tara:strand:- start:135 stop:1859 length:1725 start_codon:yes stop_codon:yes gene_type:complete
MSNNLHFVELGKYSAPTIVESSREEWIDYGDNNGYYDFLINLYNNSTTHHAIINAIVKLVYGKGLDATDSRLKPNEYAQMMMLFRKDVLRKIIADYKLLGQFALQVIYNKKKDAIIKVEHVPIQLLRAEKCNDKGEIEAYYYSDNWQEPKKFIPKRISSFGYGDKTLEILYFGNYTVGQKYYSNVDYTGAIPYVKLEENISDFLINDVENGFSGTKVVNFNNGVPDEEKQTMIVNNVTKKLTGQNGLKVIVAFNSDETKKTTVDNIPLDNAPEHYQYLSEEARSKIMLGHGVTSGLLFGINTATGFSANADEMKNASTLFDNMVIRPMQEAILDCLDKILAFNAISLNLYFKTLQPLEFIDLNSAVTAADKEIESGVKLSKQLEEFGEELNPEEWELVDSRKVDYDTEEELDAEIEKLNNPKKSLLAKLWEFVSTGRAQPNVKSEQDGVFFQSRYRYTGGQQEDTRPFCKKMLAINKLYRKEDIIAMGNNPSSNPGWGPRGVDTYDMFLYKGGGACHHYWTRETYRRIQYLKPQNNKNEISPAQARKEGEILPTNDKKVYTRPIDMPNKGFLPK